jgi:hypothetical protein
MMRQIGNDMVALLIVLTITIFLSFELFVAHIGEKT